MGANQLPGTLIPGHTQTGHSEQPSAPTAVRGDDLPLIAPDCGALEAEVAQLKLENAILEDSANTFGALAERLNERART
jgi:hypothetical protein